MCQRHGKLCCNHEKQKLFFAYLVFLQQQETLPKSTVHKEYAEGKDCNDFEGFIYYMQIEGKKSFERIFLVRVCLNLLDCNSNTMSKI